MSKNILLPTDFSDNAWNAALYAFNLYAEQTCTFHFLHSTKLPVSASYSMSNKLTRTLTKNGMKDLSDLKQKAIESNPNPKHSYTVTLSSSDLKIALEAVIKKRDIDVVVMGSRGITNSAEFIFGSNTVSIIGRVKSSAILVVPDRYEFEVPKNIAFPTDFTRNYGDELIPLKQLTDFYNSNIEILHIISQENLSEAYVNNLNQLKASLENHTYSFRYMPNYISKEQAVKDFIEQFDIDILVMINYQHSFIDSLINEPLIRRLGFQPSIPFLVIPCLA
ncbi:universal stress protein [Xanthomarina sp. F1114]|uniref:universal stress protein n=1 Tax=Xanthomarina sp. F1114 TaxID=2996019 RepID=UPI00225DCF5B|nr:universal stress protein [Xanthomarina sp. F1114]MCX7549038.1 universal stress protein [Xanthomarina sp. F1114]